LGHRAAVNAIGRAAALRVEIRVPLGCEHDRRPFGVRPQGRVDPSAGGHKERFAAELSSGIGCVPASKNDVGPRTAG